MLFTFLMGIIESFCAKELTQYLEKYHAQRKATEIAQAPENKQELLASFKSN
jgi:hypothetical protein